MTPSSSRTDCRCKLSPCACAYVITLRLGGVNAGLRNTALAAARTPGEHRRACPCPRCWSARASTWGSLWTGPDAA